MHKQKTINSIDSVMKRYSISIEQLDKNNIILFKEKMKKINDPRQQSKTSFKIWDIIVTAFISVLANQNSWDEIHDFVEKNILFLDNF